MRQPSSPHTPILAIMDYGCPMRPEALEAWTSLYAAVGLLAAICGCLALIKTAFEVRNGEFQIHTKTLSGRVLLVPKLWLRWQVLYLSGSPAILGIALAYAHFIGFPAFNPG